ncbi:MAG: hypothetical protein ACRDTE_22110 [Pseudonocardiaceae bacterium]
MTGLALATPRLITVTDARTGLAHLVTEEAMVAGRRGGSFTAVCACVVLAASLTAPERGHCRACARRLAER